MKKNHFPQCVGLLIMMCQVLTAIAAPVWKMAAPDPCVMRAADGKFYAYTTQGIGPDGKMNNIQVLRSEDLINWEHLGDALPQKPCWAQSTQNFWAPHVMQANGKYYMYFSAEPDAAYKKGKDLGLCLAVATSDRPEGPFVEKGEPMFSGDGFVNIDPMAFHDPQSGKWYMYWGSGFEPLKVRELSDDLLSFRKDVPTTELVKAYGANYQFLVEGSWVIYRNGWYYLFYSGDNCCGERAHYAVMVARSKSPTGPFEVYCKEKEGDLAILEAGGRWVAPGHNAIITDDEGTDWIVYHAIDKNDWWVYPEEKREDKRIVLIDPIEWNNGWPEVKGHIPSDTLVKTPFLKRSSMVPTIQNPLMDDEGNPVTMGDPFILRASDGKFYMYGTTDYTFLDFRVYESNDLSTWHYVGKCFEPSDDNWTTDVFWAPEVYERGGKYYMLHSSNWKHNPNHEEENFRLGVAVADKPTGPFREMYKKPIFDPGYPIIDANLYFETDGRVFLYYSRCCYKHPVKSELSAKLKKEGRASEVQESWIYGVELKPDLSGVIGKPKLLLCPPKKLGDPQSRWEDLSALAGEGEAIRRWNEGSFLFKHDDTYYMMYSTNYWRGKHYAVGYATSKSPMGPFTKAANNPVLEKNTEQGGDVYCTGHNMVLTMPDGDMYCVYHGRTAKTDSITGDAKRVAFIDKMEILEDGTLVVHGPTTYPQTIQLTK